MESLKTLEKTSELPQLKKILVLHNHPNFNEKLTVPEKILKQYQLQWMVQNQNSQKPFEVEDILRQENPYSYEITQKPLKSIICSTAEFGYTKSDFINIVRTKELSIRIIPELSKDQLNWKALTGKEPDSVEDFGTVVVLQECFEFDEIKKMYRFSYIVRCSDFEKKDMYFESQSIEIPAHSNIYKLLKNFNEVNSGRLSWLLSIIYHDLDIPDIYAELTSGAVTLNMVLENALRQAFAITVAPKLGIIFSTK